MTGVPTPTREVPSLKRVLSMLVALGVSALLLYAALRDVRLKEVVGFLPRVDLVWVPWIFILPAVDLLARAVRWRLLLAPLRKTDAWTLFKLEAVGLAINNVLFLRLGELARGYVAGKELGVPTLSVLATILVERLCDAAALFALLGASSLLLPGVVDGRVRDLAFLACAGVVGLIALLVWADSYGKRHGSWIGLERAHPRLRRFCEELMMGGRAFHDALRTARIAILSLGLWLCDAGLFWVMGRVMRLEPPLDPLQGVTIVACAAGATALPAVPGAFGNFEAAVKLILMHFGYDKSLAVGYAALSHLIMYLVVTTLGLVFLYRLGHTFSSLRGALEKR